MGDGKADDTAAIQKAVDQNKGSNRTLYFPNGTYLVHAGVGIFGGKAHSKDRFLTWQGQSERGTVIRLADHCPGFQDPAKPQVVVSVYQGDGTGDVMHSFVRNLTVDVGKGNPGAIGLRFLSNNVGAMERVTIRSSDPTGAGAIGLDLRQSQQGPCLIRRVTVEGFARGVATDNSFSIVLEHLALRNQSQVGVDLLNARTTLRGLRSDNRVPALRLGGWGQLSLVDAELRGGATRAAIVLANKDRRCYLRDVAVEGYAAAVLDRDGQELPGPRVAEWHDGKAYALFEGGMGKGSLRLPVEEAPEVPWQPDPAKWIVFQGKVPDITAALQQAIDAGVAEGRTTLCLLAAKGSKITGPIRVHGSIDRIIGMTGLVDVADPAGTFKDGSRAVFTFEDLTAPALVLERFFLLGGWDCPRYAVMCENRSRKPIVVRNCGIGGQLKKAEPGGRWFIEDVSPSRGNTLRIGTGERVWARQFNPESPQADMIEVDGGSLWLLGLKTEGRATHVVARNGAQVEVLGGVSYQSWGKQPVDPPMFRIEDSLLSATLNVYHSAGHGLPFTTVVEERLSGETRSLPRKQLATSHIHLYRSGLATPP